MPNWVKVFQNLSEARDRVPEGKPQLVIARGKRICLVNLNGKFQAVQDACSHNGESLSKGSVNYLGEIVCPWHQYRFELKTGREGEERSEDLQVFPIKCDDTGFFIGM